MGKLLVFFLIFAGFFRLCSSLADISPGLPSPSILPTVSSTIEDGTGPSSGGTRPTNASSQRVSALAQRPNGRPRKMEWDMCLPLHQHTTQSNGSTAERLLRLQREHSLPQSAIKQIFEITNEILPVDHTLPSYSDAKQWITNKRLPSFERVDVCINDCIAFINLPYLQQNNNENLTHCNICREPRKDSKGESRKVNAIYIFLFLVYFMGIPWDSYGIPMGFLWDLVTALTKCFYYF